MRRAALLCAAALGAAFAPAASAAENTAHAHTPGVLVAGPVLAASNFVYADKRGRQTRVHVVSTSGRSRVLSQFPRLVTEATEEDEFGALDFTEFDVALDASAAGVVLGVVHYNCATVPSGDSDCFEAHSEYWVATYRGPARRVLRCKRPTRDVAMGDATAAVLGCATRSDRKIHLFDVATGAGRRTITAPRGYLFVDIEAAGPFVAGEAARGNDRIVIVYDHGSGRELYRAPSSKRNQGSYALQADGKLVVAAAEASAECGNLYSPAEPVAQPLNFQPCLGVLAKDRIVTPAPLDASDDARLVVTDLRGSAAVPLTPPVDIGEGPVYDFDGRRVLEAVTVCDGVDLVAERLSDILRRGPRPARRCQIL